jgi:glyoxylase-like metal-dependent hydrolase (beta-lactamase superfamily II)
MLKLKTLVVGMISTNCYIVYDTETLQAAVVDPGAGSASIIQALRDENLSLEYIFLTHGHFDHVTALDKLRAACGGRTVAHEKEDVKVGDLTLTRDGEVFMMGDHSFEVLHTPGHTEGSICLRVKDMLFTGDTLFEDDCGRCDLPGGDYGAMLRSLRRLAGLEGDFKVYPGHDVSTTLSRERTHNKNMLEALAQKCT